MKQGRGNKENKGALVPAVGVTGALGRRGQEGWLEVCRKQTREPSSTETPELRVQIGLCQLAE